MPFDSFVRKENIPITASPCPQTAYFLNYNEYERLSQSDDPISLKKFEEIEHPVIIGTDTSYIYELESLLKMLETEMEENPGKTIRQVRARNPMTRQKFFQAVNIQPIQYDFYDREGVHHQNTAKYEETERLYTQKTSYTAKSREGKADVMRFVFDEHTQVMDISELYTMVENFLNEYIEPKKFNAIEDCATVHDKFREKIRPRFKLAAQQSDEHLSEVFTRYGAQNPTKLRKKYFTKEGNTQSYYIFNLINICQLLIDFCDTFEQTKTYEENELISDFKAYLIARNVDVRADFKTEIIKKLFNDAAIHDMCSQHIVIDKEGVQEVSESGTVTGKTKYVPLYHIGKNVVGPDQAIRRRRTRRDGLNDEDIKFQGGLEAQPELQSKRRRNRRDVQHHNERWGQMRRGHRLGSSDLGRGERDFQHLMNGSGSGSAAQSDAQRLASSRLIQASYDGDGSSRYAGGMDGDGGGASSRYAGGMDGDGGGASSRYAGGMDGDGGGASSRYAGGMRGLHQVASSSLSQASYDNEGEGDFEHLMIRHESGSAAQLRPTSSRQSPASYDGSGAGKYWQGMRGYVSGSAPQNDLHQAASLHQSPVASRAGSSSSSSGYGLQYASQNASGSAVASPQQHFDPEDTPPIYDPSWETMSAEDRLAFERTMANENRRRLIANAAMQRMWRRSGGIHPDNTMGA